MRFLFIVVFSVFFLPAASQSIVYVTQNGAGDYSGSSWANATYSEFLQIKLASASPGTQFWVAGGNYLPTIGPNRDVSFSIPSGVQVYGGFAGYESSLGERKITQPSSTTLSGNIGSINADDNSLHVVTFKNVSADTRIDGLVIKGGYGGVGAGIYNDGSGASGRSEPLIANCLITENQGLDGAGIHNNGYQGSANATIINCVLSRNSAFRNGGGIYNNGYQGVANPTIANCLLHNNTASDGGAVYNEAFQGTCNPSFLNCTLTNNKSNNSFLINNQVYNSAALYNHGPSGICQPKLTNCIIWGNTGQAYSFIYNNPGNPIINYSDIESSDYTNIATGTGNINRSPAFNDPNTSSYRLGSNSLAINAGDPSTLIATLGSTDLDGRPRLISDRIDMGAYEFQTQFTANQIVYVTQSGAGNMSGRSWLNAISSLQLKERLKSASPGTQFWISAGVYRPGNTQNDSFIIPYDVQVYGGFQGTESNLADRKLSRPSSTTLTGEFGSSTTTDDNCFTVVQFAGATANTSLNGVVVTGAYTAGINNSRNTSQGSSSTPAMSDCFVLNNYGTGLQNGSTYAPLCSMTITNCDFIGNRFQRAINTGAGSAGVARLYIQNSRFLNNSSSGGNGGAISSDSYEFGTSSLELTDCVFMNNSTTGGGGAISLTGSSSGGTISLNRCQFISNNAALGGALYVDAERYTSISTVLTNCTLISNRASNGGATYNYGNGGNSDITFVNCTVKNNSATGAGGAMFCQSAGPINLSTRTTNCIPTVINSIFNDNTSTDQSFLKNINAAPSVTYSNIQGGFSGTGNIDADPLFVDAANGNYRLLRNSPSINTGDPNSTTATVSATDLAGGARVIGGRIDMGAYEFAPTADLRLAFATSSRTLMPNQPVTYNLTITNDGPEPTSNVTWQNRLPNNLLFAGGQGVTATDGIINGSVGSLAAGASTTFSYQLQPSQAGQFVNAAQITASDIPDPDSQPNSGTGDGQDDAATVDIRVGDATGVVFSSPNPGQIPLPAVQSNQPVLDPAKIDLSLSLSVNNRTPKIGDALTYTLTILNQGGTMATGVKATAYLPNGQQFESSQTMGPSDGGITGNVTSIAPGSSITLQFTARVTEAGLGITKTQLRQASPADVDSTPDNGYDNGEDDTATIDVRTSSN